MIQKVLHNKIVQAVSVLTAVFGLIAGMWMVEDRYAKAQDVIYVAARLEQKINSDKLDNIQRRIWMLEDRYGGQGVPKAPPEIKNEYRELVRELDALKRKLGD